MPKFRKKPIVIEARQWDGSLNGAAHLCEWINGPNFENGHIAGYVYDSDGVDDFRIETLEGDHNVTPQDWIIKGVAGEFYPCKPAIFDATYEPA